MGMPMGTAVGSRPTALRMSAPMERVITFVRAMGSDMAIALRNCTQFRETSLKPPPLPQQGEGQTARGLYLYI
jgi:hypothetical protein